MKRKKKKKKKHEREFIVNRNGNVKLSTIFEVINWAI